MIMKVDKKDLLVYQRKYISEGETVWRDYKYSYLQSKTVKRGFHK